MRQNRIQEEWLSYRERVLPKNATPVQIQECRRAFYAGARAFFHCCIRTLGSGDDVTDADLQMLKDADGELEDFAKRVLRGEA